MGREKEYGDVVRLEETVDPPLHVFRRLVHWNEIKFVDDHNHRLVVDQLVQLGNDAALQKEREGEHTGRSMMSHTYRINECFLNGIWLIISFGAETGMDSFSTFPLYRSYSQTEREDKHDDSAGKSASASPRCSPQASPLE